MIRGTITHPDVIAALARAGHKSTVLITDIHYAAATCVGPNARTVFLNLTAGKPTIPEVLQAVQATVVVEHATLMQPSADALPSPLQDHIAGLLRQPVEHVQREEFYALARSRDLALAIVTGDTRRFGNVLLRLGALLDPDV
ncbi:MAG: RbsD or FucU transport [Nigerium sp.]|nr:RbsD or FucU transport [Nigerium sp.]